ncbi:hypothetical protein SAY87_014735 [Trapa incisa]|uniref:Protein LURP-one-related 5-like n=1 Tax=Trapa incisa TaxID=236973 RepID=A0AAN7JKL8_9MYRT|nr:hypothetical protein SAY87_014735 [Trapa incisa]
MSRIHPTFNCNRTKELFGEGHRSGPSVFTVWKRSSMSFQGTDGFTVFDEYGGLAFRVDNYSRKIGGCLGDGLVLMDGTGDALLTLAPKVLSMQRVWNAYGGDCTGGGRSRAFRQFSVREPWKFPILAGLKSKCQGGAEPEVKAEVFIGDARWPEYSVEGSFRRRSCCIRRRSTGDVIAKISRKSARANPRVMLEDEVFSLVVQPGLDNGLIMGLIVILDRICSGPVSPFMCCC